MLTEPRKVAIHCYGCSATVPVDANDIGSGIRFAGWSSDQGRTYCPTCAAARGLASPWPAQTSDPGVPAHSATGATDGDGGARTPLIEPSVLAAPEPPKCTAIKDPATRASLNRYRTRALLWLLVAAALLIPSIVVVSNQESRASYLLAHGTRTPGIVVQRGYTGRSDWIYLAYRVGPVTRYGKVNVQDKDDYYNGEDETVIYDPAHPSHIRTPANKNLPSSTTRPLMYGFLFGAFALIGCIGVFRRGQRWRWVLAERDWELVQSRCVVAPGRRQPATLELRRAADPESAPLRVQIGGLPGRVKKLVNRKHLWLAGGTASGFVLAIPETRELFSATLKPQKDHPLVRRVLLRNKWLFRPIGRSKNS